MVFCVRRGGLSDATAGPFCFPLEVAMRILVVEDNPINMTLFSSVLESAGLTVLKAVNARDGITLVEAEMPDMILMDVQLPGMDGLSATRMLKGKPGTSHIPIVVISAFGTLGEEEEIINSGCDAYVRKPIDYKHLLKLITDILNTGKAKGNHHA